MMTPTAQIEFFYELMYEDGTTNKNTPFRTIFGAWEAQQLIEEHGLKPPSQTTILNGKRYVYAIEKLPHAPHVTNERQLVEYFNQRAFDSTKLIVNVHLAFQRVTLKY